MIEAYEQMSTVVLLRRLLHAGPALARMPSGGKNLVGDWWRGLSGDGRRAHFRTLNLACDYVDLQNGAMAYCRFDPSLSDAELPSLERAMLDAASDALRASRAAMRQ